MNGLELAVSASAGLNLFILGAVLLSSYRVGKIEGNLKNGGYISCPFYKKGLSNSVSKSKHP